MGILGAENLSDYVFWASLLVSGINVFGPYPFKKFKMVELVRKKDLLEKGNYYIFKKCFKEGHNKLWFSSYFNSRCHNDIKKKLL